jgi:cysteine synthase A
LLSPRPGYFWPSQFESSWNVTENLECLGPEILDQLPTGTVPVAFVMGIGTGGTLAGVGQAFRAVNPNVKLFAIEPSEAATIRFGEAGPHGIEGIGDGFVPRLFTEHRSLVDDVLLVDSASAIDCSRRLARDHGLFVGPSSGAHFLIAQQVKDGDPALKTTVTAFCDDRAKYLGSLFGKGEPDQAQASAGAP